MAQGQSTCGENDDSCALGRRLESSAFASQSPYLSRVRMTLMQMVSSSFHEVIIGGLLFTECLAWFTRHSPVPIALPGAKGRDQ